MAESGKIYTGRQYYAKHQGDTANIPTDYKGLGYYSRTNVQDVVTNFIIAYIGDDKALPKVPRYEVEFWAQRGVQEFSYDVLHSEKSIEVELGDSLAFPLPQDYVNLVALSLIDDKGIKTPILRNRKAGNPSAPLQDGDYNYTFDSNGDLQYASQSESLTKFKESRTAEDVSEDEDQYHSGEDLHINNKRYGSNPENMNSAPTYFIDEANGIMYFDGSLASREDNLIVLDYITDGLTDNDDLSKVFIPKLAEDALYAFILYNLSKVRPQSAALVPLYKKEASAKMRNTKIRLSNYNLQELAQVLRGKAKWIKH